MIKAAFEKLLRIVYSLPTNPVVINLEMFVSRDDIGRKQMGIYFGHEEVLKYYQVPTLNYDLSAIVKFFLTDRHPAW